MSLVRIRNVHPDRTYTLYNDIHGDVVIAPGQERIVQLEVAVVSLGNPGAENRGPTAADRVRDAEVRRIEVLWGFYAGLYADSAWNGVGIDKTTGDEIGPFAPQIEVSDLDGNRMWMIHDDPTGIHRSVGVDDRIVDVTSGHAVEAELASLQDQVRHLTDILTAQQSAIQGAEPSVDPASTEAKMAAALTDDGTQAERNAARFDIPKPSANATVSKDKPRTSRTGSRVSAAG